MGNKSSIWTKSKKIEVEKELIITELFKEEESLKKEFNSNQR